MEKHALYCNCPSTTLTTLTVTVWSSSQPHSTSMHSFKIFWLIFKSYFYAMLTALSVAFNTVPHNLKFSANFHDTFLLWFFYCYSSKPPAGLTDVFFLITFQKNLSFIALFSLSYFWATSPFPCWLFAALHDQTWVFPVLIETFHSLCVNYSTGDICSFSPALPLLLGERIL